jgi:hypothetical protein
MHPVAFFEEFQAQLTESLTASALDARVVGFKSVICYRTGLDVAPTLQDDCDTVLLDAFVDFTAQYQSKQHVRLANKYFNDHAVRITLEVAGKHNKPGKSV